MGRVGPQTWNGVSPDPSLQPASSLEMAGWLAEVFLGISSGRGWMIMGNSLGNEHPLEYSDEQCVLCH